MRADKPAAKVPLHFSSLVNRVCACRRGVGAAHWWLVVRPICNRGEGVVRYFCAACVALLVGTPRSGAADKEAKLSATEQQMVENVNQIRKKAKLPPVKPNATLCGCARAHAAGMAKKGELKQSFDGKPPLDRVKAAGYDADHVATLVAQGGDALGPVFMQLLGEKTCRQEILRRDATEVGVGLASDGKGKVYYNIVLAKPK
jgi:uncharacterized protein YkwD